MIIYLINILLLFIWKLIFLNENSKNGKKIFVFLGSIQWFILSAFRDLNIGDDTQRYGMMFYQETARTWSQTFSDSYNILTGVTKGKDIGFMFFQKLCASINGDYRFMLIVIAALLATSLGVFIYRNSVDPFFSFLLFSCLFYSFFAITGERQTIATSLVIFFGYELIKKRKLVKFLIIVFFAALIHKSCLVCIPLYFLINKKITNLYLLCIAATAMICFFFRDALFSFLASGTGYESYSTYTTGGYTFTTMFLVVAALAIMFKNNMLNSNNEQATHFINALMLALCVLPLTFSNPNAMRIVQYFSAFLMLLIPLILQSFENRYRLFLTFSGEILLVVLFALQNPVYYFM
ncbi:MAG: EpsG family protein [Bacillota bacterium]|nr:EpsG family protein [Bacillota bacterium]